MIIAFKVKAFAASTALFWSLPKLGIGAGKRARESVGHLCAFNVKRLCAKEAPAHVGGSHVLLRSPSHESRLSWRSSQPGACAVTLAAVVAA